MQQIQRELGDRIRKLRKKKGWSQEEFAAQYPDDMRVSEYFRKKNRWLPSSSSKTLLSFPAMNEEQVAVPPISDNAPERAAG